MGGFLKAPKMFFFSVSDVLCAISDAANMNGCLVLHTLSNTAKRSPQGEKRPCLISYGSWPICFQYRWPIPQSVNSFSTCFVLILWFLKGKGQISVFFPVFFVCKIHLVYSMYCVDFRLSLFLKTVHIVLKQFYRKIGSMRIKVLQLEQGKCKKEKLRKMCKIWEAVS